MLNPSRGIASTASKSSCPIAMEWMLIFHGMKTTEKERALIDYESKVMRVYKMVKITILISRTSLVYFLNHLLLYKEAHT